jgi:hypothetical protein
MEKIKDLSFAYSCSSRRRQFERYSSLKKYLHYRQQWGKGGVAATKETRQKKKDEEISSLRSLLDELK